MRLTFLAKACLAGAGLASAAALAVPASAAAQPAGRITASAAARPAAGGWMALVPVGSATLPNPHCKIYTYDPHKQAGQARVNGELKCEKTVTNIVLTVKLYRNGQLEATHKAGKDSAKDFTVQARKACKSTKPGTFKGTSSVWLRYRGREFHNPKPWPSPKIPLPCGF